MGLIERLLVATMLVLAVVGVCSLIGSAVLGMILGLFVFGYFSYIGFIPLWSIALVVTLGVIIISLGAKQ